MSKLRRFQSLGLTNAQQLARRLARWYAAPSGLLLLASLVLLGASLARIPGGRILGIVGIVLLGGFLTYRFSRQQGFLVRRIEALDKATSQRADRRDQIVNGHLGDLRKKIDTVPGLIDTSVQPVANRLAETKAELQSRPTRAELEKAGQEQMLRLDYRSRRTLSASEQNAVRLTKLEAQDEKRTSEADALLLRVEDALANHQEATLSTNASNANQRVELSQVVAQQADTISALEEAQREAQAELASLRSLLEQQQTRIDEDRVLLDGLTPVGDARPTEIDADAVSSVTADIEALGAEVATLRSTAKTVDRLRSDVAMWIAGANRNADNFAQSAVLLGPERCGTTWVFDVLRSLPGASQMASRLIYDTLGATGNRYPIDLVNIERNGEAIEFGDRRGGFLPSLRSRSNPRPAGGLLAVEKVHPSAMQFDPVAFRLGIQRLAGKTGPVHVVALVRQPVDSFRSFRAYQEHAGWQSDLIPDEVAQLFAESLRMMKLVQQDFPDAIVVTYEQLVANPVQGFTRIGNRLGLKLDETDVAEVLEAAKNWRTTAADSSYFAASASTTIPKARQLILGRDASSTAARDALSEARELYQELAYLSYLGGSEPER